MNILDYIPEGKENAVTREYLSKMTGWPDRQVRKEIKRLVTEGVPILSSSSAKGYWLSDNIGEIEAFIRESRHRRNTESRTLNKLERMVMEKQGIRFVTVREHVRRIGTGNLKNQTRFEV